LRQRLGTIKDVYEQTKPYVMMHVFRGQNFMPRSKLQSYLSDQSERGKIMSNGWTLRYNTRITRINSTI
jgi:hypothetical protein